MFLSKRICSNLVRNNYYKTISTNSLYLLNNSNTTLNCNNINNELINNSNSNNNNNSNKSFYGTKKTVSKNLNKLKKKKRVNKIPISSTKKLLAKYAMENPDDPNDNPGLIDMDFDEDEDDYNEQFINRQLLYRNNNNNISNNNNNNNNIDEDEDPSTFTNDEDDDYNEITQRDHDFIDDEEFDKELKEKLNMDQDEEFGKDYLRDNSILERKNKQLKKVESEIESLTKQQDQVNAEGQEEDEHEDFYEDVDTFTDDDIDLNDENPEHKAMIEQEMKLEFWARQMALRDSLKTDGGAFLLDEKSYTEPIKNYKIMGKKLMKKRFEERKKEKEERKQLREKIKKMKLAEMGIDQELEQEIDQMEKEEKIKTQNTLKDLLSEEEFNQIQQKEGGENNEDLDDDDDIDELYDNDGLPNLSRLRPHTHVPAPLEIVKEFLEIRKEELMKKSEEAADEFERKRRIKRIEFMARKKELQHKQMLENFKNKGMIESIITDEDDLPLEISPALFSRFQRGEITEEEMFEISKNQEREQEEEEEEFDHEGRKKRNNEFLKHWKIGSIGIPPLLKKRIAQTIKQMPTAELRSKASQLSDSLRERTRSGSHAIGNELESTDDKPVIVYGRGEAMAYISHRMPGVYACTHRVFSEIKARIPNFNPTTLLDYGSGPGTVLWSASTIWGEHLKRIRAVEPSTFMVEIAKKLMEGNTNHIKWSNFLNTAQLERRDGTIAETEMNELVTASYVLSELPDQLSRFNLVKELWRHVRPAGMLVIIEPGTPVGFGIIKEIRQMLLDEGDEQLTIHKSTKAQVVAPCPHSGKCPLGIDSWCHFSQRVERPVFQKLAKGPASTMPYEDEKYSYIVLSKVIKSSIPNQLEKQLNIYGEEELKETKDWSRLIAAPLKRGGHVIMDVCSPDKEINRVTVAKSSGKQIYKEARKSFWSDSFILPDDVVNKMEHRFNSTPEQQEEMKRQKELEQQKLLKSKKKLSNTTTTTTTTTTKKPTSVIREIEKEEERQRNQENRSIAEKKKEDEWMNELGGGDRKILEKLIKQGKFSTEESSSLFGDPKALEKPIREKAKAGLEFIDDIEEKDAEHKRELEEEMQEKERKQNQMIESKKSRKTRKVQLLKDMNQFKRQSLSPEERNQLDKEKAELLNHKQQLKESDPTRIEYYLKNMDNETPISQEEADIRFKQRLDHQNQQKQEFDKVSGFGINTKLMRDKKSEKEKSSNPVDSAKFKFDKIAEFKKYKEQQLKRQKLKQQQQEIIDNNNFNSVD